MERTNGTEVSSLPTNPASFYHNTTAQAGSNQVHNDDTLVESLEEHRVSLGDWPKSETAMAGLLLGADAIGWDMDSDQDNNTSSKNESNSNNSVDERQSNRSAGPSLPKIVPSPLRRGREQLIAISEEQLWQDLTPGVQWVIFKLLIESQSFSSIALGVLRLTQPQISAFVQTYLKSHYAWDDYETRVFHTPWTEIMDAAKREKTTTASIISHLRPTLCTDHLPESEIFKGVAFLKAHRRPQTALNLYEWRQTGKKDFLHLVIDKHILFDCMSRNLMETFLSDGSINREALAKRLSIERRQVKSAEAIQKHIVPKHGPARSHQTAAAQDASTTHLTSTSPERSSTQRGAPRTTRRSKELFPGYDALPAGKKGKLQSVARARYPELLPKFVPGTLVSTFVEECRSGFIPAHLDNRSAGEISQTTGQGNSENLTRNSVDTIVANKRRRPNKRATRDSMDTTKDEPTSLSKPDFRGLESGAVGGSSANGVRHHSSAAIQTPGMPGVAATAPVPTNAGVSQTATPAVTVARTSTPGSEATTKRKRPWIKEVEERPVLLTPHTDELRRHLDTKYRDVLKPVVSGPSTKTPKKKEASAPDDDDEYTPKKKRKTTKKGRGQLDGAGDKDAPSGGVLVRQKPGQARTGSFDGNNGGSAHANDKETSADPQDVAATQQALTGNGQGMRNKEKTPHPKNNEPLFGMPRHQTMQPGRGRVENAYYAWSADSAEFASVAQVAKFALKADRIVTQPPQGLEPTKKQIIWHLNSAFDVAERNSRGAPAADAAEAQFAGCADKATYALEATNAYYADELTGIGQGGQQGPV